MKRPFYTPLLLHYPPNSIFSPVVLPPVCSIDPQRRVALPRDRDLNIVHLIIWVPNKVCARFGPVELLIWGTHGMSDGYSRGFYSPSVFPSCRINRFLDCYLGNAEHSLPVLFRRNQMMVMTSTKNLWTDVLSLSCKRPEKSLSPESLSTSFFASESSVCSVMSHGVLSEKRQLCFRE